MRVVARVGAIFLLCVALLPTRGAVAGPPPCDLQALLLALLEQTNFAQKPLGAPLPVADLPRFEHHTGVDEFHSSGRVLHWDGRPPMRGNKEFVASNEFDWWRMEMDREPTDVVIGFGTNSAWDLAVRKNAQLLIIGDWDQRPLLAQHFLFEPLFSVARTPADFLSLLSGVPVPPHLSTASLAKVFNYIDEYLGNYADNPEQLRMGRQLYLKETFTRFVANRSLSREQIQSINTYFYDLLNNDVDPHTQVGPISGWLAQMYRDPGASPLWYFFMHRYNPDFLISAGAPSTLVKDPLFSFLSSQQAFDRLKRLMDGHIRYVEAPYQDPLIYKKAKALGDSEGLDSYTVSLTNILDCVSPTECANQKDLSSFLRATARTLGSRNYPLTVVRSRNFQEPHHFERFVVGTPGDVDAQVRSNVVPVPLPPPRQREF